jgi:putative hemolysin
MTLLRDLVKQSRRNYSIPPLLDVDLALVADGDGDSAVIDADVVHTTIGYVFSSTRGRKNVTSRCQSPNPGANPKGLEEDR